MRYRILFSVAGLMVMLLAGCDSGEPGSDNPCGIPQADPSYGAFFSDPAWHPGGRFIAAEHADSLDTDDDGRLDRFFSGLWLVDAETGETKPLLEGHSAPAWSPDGQRLAVHRDAQIYTVKVENLGEALVDLSSLRQVTSEGRNFFPAWSPDGEWIAYDNTVCGSLAEPPPPNSCGVLVTSLDGDSLRLVAPWGRIPDWSPSGQYVTFESYIPVTAEGIVTVVDGAGGEAMQLTSSEFDAGTPKYSPDGTRIAFQSETRRGGMTSFHIQTINPDGSDLRRLAPDYAWSFGWSPDGEHIVFLRHNPLIGDRWSGQLWLMDADGSNARQLTNYFPAWGREPECMFG